MSQPMEALAKANDVRLARAELKRRVLAGEVTPEEVLRTIPWEAVTMTVGDLLAAQHRWGGRRVRKLMSAWSLAAEANLHELKKVGDLTDRQRGLLLNVMRGPQVIAVERKMDRRCFVCAAEPGQPCWQVRGHAWAVNITDIPRKSPHPER